MSTISMVTVLRLHSDSPTDARLCAFISQGGIVSSDGPESYGASFSLEAADGRLTNFFVPDAGDDPWDVKISRGVNRALDRLDALLAGGWTPRPNMSEWEQSHLPSEKRVTFAEWEAQQEAIFAAKSWGPIDLGGN